MSKWDQLNLDNIITDILSNVHYADPSHHLGRPFLSAYQIAIELNIHHPGIVEQIGFPIGGKGTNEHNSLAQYVARILSQKIRNQQLTNIEGGFISNRHLHTIMFKNRGEIIESSMTNSNNDLSLFRLID